MLSRIVEIAQPHDVKTVRDSQSAMETAAIWKGRKSAFGATGRIADYICMDGTIPTGQLPYVLKRIDEICASYGLRVANVFHAGDGNMHPLIMYNVNDPGEMRSKAEEAGDGHPEALRRGRRLPHRRARRRHREARPDALPVQRRPISQQQMRVRAVFDPRWLLNPAKVFPLDGRDAA